MLFLNWEHFSFSRFRSPMLNYLVLNILALHCSVYRVQTVIMGVHMLKKEGAVFQTREEAEEADHARY